MTPETKHALNEINRRFYAALADDFSASRQAPWAGWERLLPILEEIAGRSSELRVLDVGCGNGRFGAFLHERLARPLHYHGIDFCEALLDHARTAHRQCPGCTFESRDLLASPFSQTLPAGPCDVVVLFGLLHHVPSFEARRALLVACLDRVAIGGVLVATAWRFGASARFTSRTIDWKRAREEFGFAIEVEDLEAGDHLLSWADSGLPRFCHFTDRDELHDFVEGLPAEWVDEFDADGRSDDLNHYMVLRRH